MVPNGRSCQTGKISVIELDLDWQLRKNKTISSITICHCLFIFQTGHNTTDPKLQFEYCQCQLIHHSGDLKEMAKKEKEPLMTWTKLNEIQIGSCQCCACETLHQKVTIESTKQKDLMHERHISVNTFAKPLLPDRTLSTTRPTYRLDVGEVKSSILETAFETAESLASIGAIVSI